LATVLNLLKLTLSDDEWDELDDDSPWEVAEERGYFVNESTLEAELFESGLAQEMGQVIEQELSLSEKKRAELTDWIKDPADLDRHKLLALIERIGKGRFAQALAPTLTRNTCPPYIRAALKHIRDAVS
jgi:putative ATP-dependent endonuclease of the OLD family